MAHASYLVTFQRNDMSNGVYRMLMERTALHSMRIPGTPPNKRQ